MKTKRPGRDAVKTIICERCGKSERRSLQGRHIHYCLKCNYLVINEKKARNRKKQNSSTGIGRQQRYRQMILAWFKESSLRRYSETQTKINLSVYHLPAASEKAFRSLCDDAIGE